MDRSALHRRASALLLASAMAWLSGCAQPGPLARRGTMIGTLKSEVAQLESEKDQARREVAELRTENKRIEAQLAEIESENGDLATRLDDARAVISRQGLDSGTLAPPSRTATDSNRRASPIRSQSKGRKTPMAEIPRERRNLPDSGDLPLDGLEAPEPIDRNDDGPQSRLDDRSPWLPVARKPIDAGRSLR